MQRKTVTSKWSLCTVHYFQTGFTKQVLSILCSTSSLILDHVQSSWQQIWLKTKCDFLTMVWNKENHKKRCEWSKSETKFCPSGKNLFSDSTCVTPFTSCAVQSLQCNGQNSNHSQLIHILWKVQIYNQQSGTASKEQKELKLNVWLSFGFLQAIFDYSLAGQSHEGMRIYYCRRVTDLCIML